MYTPCALRCATSVRKRDEAGRGGARRDDRLSSHVRFRQRYSAPPPPRTPKQRKSRIFFCRRLGQGLEWGERWRPLLGGRRTKVAELFLVACVRVDSQSSHSGGGGPCRAFFFGATFYTVAARVGLLFVRLPVARCRLFACQFFARPVISHSGNQQLVFCCCGCGCYHVGTTVLYLNGVVNPFRTPVPFSGHNTQIPSSLSQVVPKTGRRF